MKRIRIHIPERKDQTTAVMEVMRRGRITCLRGNEFIVPEPALALLDDLGVTYKRLNEVGPEDAHDTVRDTAAAAL